MKTLYILKKYNNYFNRIVKKEATLAKYLAAAEAYNTIPNANFAIGDGVSTTHVHNFPVGTQSFEGNYLLVVDNGVIESRWFILENYWNREGQYILTLRRDLIIDFYDAFADSGFYCEKGLPTNGYEEFSDVNGLSTYTYPDPAIFNTEPLSFNEIRKESILLKDNYDCQWIVFFTTALLEGYQGWGEDGKPDPNGTATFGYYPEGSTSTNDAVKIKLKANKIIASEAPYAIWAMPYPKHELTIHINEGSVANIFTINKTNTMAMANNIIEQLGGALYDIQLVPYCPNPYLMTLESNDVFVANANDLVGYSDTSGIVVLPVPNSHIEFGAYGGIGSIPAGNVISNHIVNPEDGLLNAKIESQCTKLRVLDQFGSAIAEWNPLSIGYIEAVNIAMTLKPLQTTISLVPIYQAGALYQFDETSPIEGKDRRGCISRSSFSLPRISDAWVQFSQNNINFNNMFNRQLDTQTRQYEIQNQLADKAGSLNVFSAAFSGANGGVGNFAGLGNILGPIGNVMSMGLGGLVAAGASTEGFNIDRAARYEQTELALSLAKDTHAMEVANIKARPDTLSKIGVFDVLTDDYFVLEVYTCTDAEKQWFKDYLRYHGCTINHISTFRTEADKIINQPGGDQFVTSFVRGTLLRCNLEDSHTANELMTELMKGVYIAL